VIADRLIQDVRDCLESVNLMVQAANLDFITNGVIRQSIGDYPQKKSIAYFR